MTEENKRKFPLTSIRCDDALDAAQEVMDRLLVRGDLSGGRGTVSGCLE